MITRTRSALTPLVHWARRVLAIGFVAGLAALLSGCDSGGSPSDRSRGPASAVRSRVLDLDGRSVDPFEKNQVQARVFVFVANDCPISNRYAPEIRRLHGMFHSKGIEFWLVHPDVDESADAIRKHTEEFGYPATVIRDPEHALVRRAQVQVTPEAAVFLPDGRLIYHGRIDDHYVELGKDRPEPTKRDLQEVLDAILKGDPGTPRSTRAVGCYIADK